MIATHTVYQACGAGDTPFKVPGTPDNKVVFLGALISRAFVQSSPLVNIRRTPENPPDTVVRDAYIFVMDAGTTSGGLFQNIPTEVEGGDNLVLNSNTNLYVILFFNVA